MPTLVIEHAGTRRGGTIPGRVLIGRLPTNGIPVPESNVSRLHAWIDRTADGQYFVGDCGSLTGTFVNGQPVEGQQTLASGDKIKIGKALVTFLATNTLPAGVAKIDLAGKPPIEDIQSAGILFDCVCGAPHWVKAPAAGQTQECRHCGRAYIVPSETGSVAQTLVEEPAPVEAYVPADHETVRLEPLEEHPPEEHAAELPPIPLEPVEELPLEEPVAEHEPLPVEEPPVAQQHGSEPLGWSSEPSPLEELPLEEPVAEHELSPVEEPLAAPEHAAEPEWSSEPLPLEEPPVEEPVAEHEPLAVEQPPVAHEPAAEPEWSSEPLPLEELPLEEPVAEHEPLTLEPAEEHPAAPEPEPWSKAALEDTPAATPAAELHEPEPHAAEPHEPQAHEVAAPQADWDELEPVDIPALEAAAHEPEPAAELHDAVSEPVEESHAIPEPMPAEIAVAHEEPGHSEVSDLPPLEPVAEHEELAPAGEPWHEPEHAEVAAEVTEPPSPAASAPLDEPGYPLSVVVAPAAMDEFSLPLPGMLDLREPPPHPEPVAEPTVEVTAPLPLDVEAAEPPVELSPAEHSPAAEALDEPLVEEAVELSEDPTEVEPVEAHEPLDDLDAFDAPVEPEPVESADAHAPAAPRPIDHQEPIPDLEPDPFAQEDDLPMTAVESAPWADQPGARSQSGPIPHAAPVDDLDEVLEPGPAPAQTDPFTAVRPEPLETANTATGLMHDAPAAPLRAGTRLCSICQTAIAPKEQMHTCPSCGLTFHEECWIENHGCSAYGCPQVNVLAPAAAIPKAPLSDRDAGSALPKAAAPRESGFPLEFIFLAASVGGALLGAFVFGGPAAVVAICTLVYAVAFKGPKRRGVLWAAIIISLIGIVAGVFWSNYFWFGSLLGKWAHR